MQPLWYIKHDFLSLYSYPTVPQARHELSSRRTWNSKDTHFDYQDFFKVICDMFNNKEDPWYKSTLDCWNL